MSSKITPQRGLGQISLYKPGRPIEEVRKEFGINDVIKLASNENPIGPSPKAIEALIKGIAQINYYPDGQSAALCNALAQKSGVKPEQITVGNGADGLIVETCLAFLDENCEAIVSQSSFPVYDTYIRVMRAKLVKTPLKNYGLDLDAMLAAITERTKLIFVCNPNNPTGTYLPKSEVDAFMARVPDHVLVVFDEAYYEFVEAPDFPDTLNFIREGRENVLLFRTFSKVYGLAGVRVGYAVGAPELIASLHAIKEPFAVNSLAQIAGLAAMEDEAFMRQTVDTNRAAREYLYAEFSRMGLFYVKSQTNFVLVELGEQMETIVKKLMEQGVIIRPGGGYNLPRFARVSVGTLEQNKRLIETLEGIIKSLM
jgi:histidinol-phosphate aminotransferase